jgi:hypothetical protein
MLPFSDPAAPVACFQRLSSPNHSAMNVALPSLVHDFLLPAVRYLVHLSLRRSRAGAIMRPCKPRQKCRINANTLWSGNHGCQPSATRRAVARNLFVKRLPPNPGQFQKSRFLPKGSTACSALHSLVREKLRITGRNMAGLLRENY